MSYYLQFFLDIHRSHSPYIEFLNDLLINPTPYKHVNTGTKKILLYVTTPYDFGTPPALTNRF